MPTQPTLIWSTLNHKDRAPSSGSANPGRPAPGHLADLGRSTGPAATASQPCRRPPSKPRPGRHRRLHAGQSCRNDGHDGMADLDLVALLQQLGSTDPAPVEHGAVGRAEVIDVPHSTNGVEAAMLTGGEVVLDGQFAVAAGSEVGTEALTLVTDLDDQGWGVRPLGDGGSCLPGDGGRGGLPGLLLLLA